MSDIITENPSKLKNKHKNINHIPIDIFRFIEFVEIKNNFHECFDNYQENVISVSTITAQYKMRNKIDLIELKNKLLNHKLLIANNCQKEFKNQLTICLSYNFFQHKRKLSIKIFKSGCIHICGLKNIKMITFILNICKILLEKLLDQTFIIEPSNIKICLIAMKIDTNQNLDLITLKRNVNVDFQKYCYYEPSKYSGLNIKLKLSGNETSTILIFSSGKIILCIKNPKHLFNIVNFLNNILISVNSNIIKINSICF
tara:strand:- start:270 stop:1040 length:771 start_codon:yes stop_codon:yes gene_type:complete